MENFMDSFDSYKSLSLSEFAGRRVVEPSKSKWSPPPMDTRSPRRATNALPATCDGIEHLMKGNRIDGMGSGKWATGIPTHWTKQRQKRKLLF
ncbi:hypothetical protein EVAR_40540_1 [Eumeta japonica]|uniref:Uncharacterized protein n=1 Tax=Eumeta variegata TaxID=151549 RepID=A0A4C1XTU4_EUMVA|nr:hypothetical protein EVAR_40540_1 [Eumeta japonica]